MSAKDPALQDRLKHHGYQPPRAIAASAAAIKQRVRRNAAQTGRQHDSVRGMPAQAVFEVATRDPRRPLRLLDSSIAAGLTAQHLRSGTAQLYMQRNAALLRSESAADASTPASGAGSEPVLLRAQCVAVAQPDASALTEQLLAAERRPADVYERVRSNIEGTPARAESPESGEDVDMAAGDAAGSGVAPAHGGAAADGGAHAAAAASIALRPPALTAEEATARPHLQPLAADRTAADPPFVPFDIRAGGVDPWARACGGRGARARHDSTLPTHQRFPGLVPGERLLAAAPGVAFASAYDCGPTPQMLAADMWYFVQSALGRAAVADMAVAVPDFERMGTIGEELKV